MNPNEEIQAIIEIFHQLNCVTVNRIEWTSDGLRTREFLTALCQRGLQENYQTCARSDVVDEQFRTNNWGEWLYDVVWLDSDENWSSLRSVPLVAECEWGNLGDVFDDFPKLIVARAIVRVMVCNGDLRAGNGEPWLTPEDVVAKLTEWIGTFECTQKDDTYLLVTYQWNHNESPDWNEDSRYYLRYFKIMGNGPSQLPNCEELFQE